MINERDRHIWQQMLAAVELFCSAPHHPAPLCDFARGKMTGEMLAFGIAVGVASLVCYLLMTRLQNRRANRRSPCDGPSPEAGNFTGADGWSISSWFGGDNPAFYSSGNPSDSGGSDSGGGGDAGGGGGGGGGGD
jgi:hypothetical protein